MDIEKGSSSGSGVAEKPYSAASITTSRSSVASSRLRRFWRRTRWYILGLLFALLLGLVIWQTVVAVGLRNLYNSLTGAGQPRPEVVQEYELRRQIQAAKYHPYGSDRALLFKDIEEGHDAYVARLRKFTIEYIPENHRKPILRMLAALQQHRPPPLIQDRLNYIPQVIHSTNPQNTSIPDVFAAWNRTHPEWKIKMYDDAGMEAWVNTAFKGTAWPAIFSHMPKKIYQVDTFRYAALLLEGGVYTDSDTAPTFHITTWGHYPVDRLNPALAGLLPSIANQEQFPAKYLDRDGTQHIGDIDIQRHPILDPTVAAVVSVEYDALYRNNLDDPGDWSWYVRPLQICQWTMMAKPYHPIFLDVLERITRKTEERVAVAQFSNDTYDGWTSPLQYAGPGPFTDAVFRYLMVQYGFNPRDRPPEGENARIGDVVMLPQGSFAEVRQVYDQDVAWNSTQLWKTSAISHEDLGRWRKDDPGMDRERQGLPGFRGWRKRALEWLLA